MKFITSVEASSIFFNRGSVHQLYSIKLDFSKEELCHEPALLKELWALIQSGINCKSIKIHNNNSIYVDNKPLGKCGD